LISKCEKLVGLKVDKWEIKKMRTKWGSCNIENKKILLNLELAKKSVECIEYIIIHELVHLLERYHNESFKNYMDKFIPHWRERRDELNNGILENY
jgi:predicted metal-dependent hydrolase